MFAILEDTNDRLVIRIGSKGSWYSALFSLDRAARRMRVERKYLFVRRKTLDLPFSEIVRVDWVTDTYSSIILGLRSGKRRYCAGDNELTTADATERMRSFMGLQPVAGSPMSRIYVWSTAIVSVVGAALLVLVYASQIMSYFFLPSCSDHEPRDAAMRGGGGTEELTDVKTITNTHAEKTCQATSRDGSGPVFIDYRIYWDGWTPMVQTLGVGTARAIDASKIADVKNASDQFLALAEAAKTAEQLPPSTDEAVGQILDKVFDTSSVEPAKLRDADLGDLIGWFNAGHAVGAVYVLAGTRYREFAEVPEEPTVQDRIRKNVVDYAPEVGRYLDFEVRILSLIAASQRATMAAVGAVEAKVVTDRLAQFRSTFSAAMQTSLGDLDYDGLSDDWRRARVAQIAAAADTAANFLTKDQLRDLRNLILKTQSRLTNARLREELKSLEARFAADG